MIKITLTKKYHCIGRWTPEKPPAPPALHKALPGGRNTLRSGQPALPQCSMSLLSHCREHHPRSAPASCSPSGMSPPGRPVAAGMEGRASVLPGNRCNWASHRTLAPHHTVAAPRELPTEVTTRQEPNLRTQDTPDKLQVLYEHTVSLRVRIKHEPQMAKEFNKEIKCTIATKRDFTCHQNPFLSLVPAK